MKRGERLITALKNQNNQYKNLVRELKSSVSKRKHSNKHKAYDIFKEAKEVGNNNTKLNLQKLAPYVKPYDTISTIRAVEHTNQQNTYDKEPKVPNEIQDYISNPISTGLIEIKKLANLENFFIVIFI